MHTKAELLEVLGKYVPADEPYQTAQAELNILMAQESQDLLQKTREVLAEMSRGIVAFRQVVDRAATDSANTARLLVTWTRVLSFATIGLMLATVALVYATFKGH